MVRPRLLKEENVNKLIGVVLAFILGFGLIVPDAEAARRMGGGKSLGMQRQATPPAKRPDQAQQAAPQQPGAAAAPAAAAGSRWLGPVAGLLAGGLIGALIFGGAFDGIKFMDVLIVLLIAAGIFFLFRKMGRNARVAPQRPDPLQYAGAGIDPARAPQPQPPAVNPMPSAAAAGGARHFPVGFDPDAFARQARNNFVRLQEANDRGDLAALRDMMTPELYREIEAQMQERAGAAQKTEVVTLDAQVIDVVTEGNQYVASVRFSGLIKEDPAPTPEPFSEIWHLQKPLDGSSGWLMAGIQQD
jgi:predicted lipid-binding transport protein (Tim44 family)